MYIYIYIRKFYDVSNKLICVLIVIIFQHDTFILRAKKKKIEIIVSIHVNVSISRRNYT